MFDCLSNFCLFLQKGKDVLYDDNLDAEDCSKFISHASETNWKDENLIEGIRNRFVTKGWSKAAAAGVPTDAVSDDNDGVDDDGDVFGDFEDLETGQKYESQQRNDVSAKSDEALAAEERRLKKLALRAKFDAQYPSHKIEFIVLSISCIPLHS